MNAVNSFSLLVVACQALRFEDTGTGHTPNAPDSTTKSNFTFLMVAGGLSILGGLIIGLLLYVLALTVLAISYLAGAFIFVSKHTTLVVVGLAIIALHAAVILGPVSWVWFSPEVKHAFIAMLVVTVLVLASHVGFFTFLSKYAGHVWVLLAINGVHSAIILGPVRRTAAAVGATGRARTGLTAARQSRKKDY
ncbi:hypothetical protein CONLIGDRAFT_686158 [Coniochaeta ligniaria NRRL 30616]|uniref:Uncharacterized protein n=1 Tax=Coniochaeta ligniaria NRRL 30616 TaxID=1408157 RepID=A0A1J7I8Y3_9PEZI|nr:hypothetical protein CONLIGDRAFT_686158 [Coniochaeta ligniaria NRRL 30616]